MSDPREVGRDPGAASAGRGRTRSRRESTETKASYKTTELIAYIAAVVGVLIAGLIVDSNGRGADNLAANRVWLYVTILTGAYMIARGLAKSGSREPYYDD